MEHFAIKETFENFGYIILDCALDDDDLKGHITDVYSKYKIEAEIIRLGGPSGWPEVKYTGRRSSIIKMARKDYEEDEEFIDEYFTKI